MHKINKTLFLIGIVFVTAVVLVYFGSESGEEIENQVFQKSAATEKSPVVSLRTKEPVHDGHHGNHDQRRQPSRVPAFFQNAPERNSLPRTLDPDRFAGQVREAYRVVREIPETIAQLPCFCYCDHGFGHRSLHSCFEDEHGSRCAICINEAINAYRLQKEENLSPEQIRGRIIAQYAR